MLHSNSSGEASWKSFVVGWICVWILQTSWFTESECACHTAHLHFTHLCCLASSWLFLGFQSFRGKDVCYTNLCILLHTHLVPPPPNCALLLYPAQWLLRSAVPCCSYQFERMFNTCRIPGTLTGSILCWFFFLPSRPSFVNITIIFKIVTIITSLSVVHSCFWAFPSTAQIQKTNIQNTSFW